MRGRSLARRPADIGGKLEWQDLAESEITRWNYDIPNWQEAVEKLLFREAEEESGLIKVSDPKYLTSVAYVRTDGVPVVCPKFALMYKSGKVKLAPEFDDFALNEEEVKNYHIIKGIDKEIALTIAYILKSY